MNDLPLVIANLKANKTWDDLSSWMNEIGPKADNFVGTVVMCPSYPFLAAAAVKIKSAGWKIKLGSQDLSKFEQGAYTGEVAAGQIADLVDYAIIGHSERRQNFGEDDYNLARKVQNAKGAGIEPIFCVGGAETIIVEGVEIVAYEPIFAIGTGKTDTPENAWNVSGEVKRKGRFTVIYGGSVSGENVGAFIKKDVLDGVLVGTNSLDPQNFIKILNSANY